MSYARYRRRGMGSVASQPPGARVAASALGATMPEWATIGSTVAPPPRRVTVARSLHGISSQPPGQRIAASALGGIFARTTVPPGSPVPVPYPSIHRGIFGDDTAPAVTDPQWAQDLIATERAHTAWQQDWMKLESRQRWIQIIATVSIPLAAAIWRALGIGRR